MSEPKKNVTVSLPVNLFLEAKKAGIVVSTVCSDALREKLAYKSETDKQEALSDIEKEERLKEDLTLITAELQANKPKGYEDLVGRKKYASIRAKGKRLLMVAHRKTGHDASVLIDNIVSEMI